LISSRSIVTCLLLVFSAIVVGSSVESSPSTVPFIYTVAKTYDSLAWMRGRERFPSGATIRIHELTNDRALVPEFIVTADPAVSFEGERILVAGKRGRGDPWQIWEISLGDHHAREITSGKEDCIRPLYLPDDRIVYARKIHGSFQVEVADLNGKNVLALTYGAANFLPSDILRDGRILFEAGYPLGSDTTPEIYAVYSDGSGVESYRCDHGKTHHEGRQVSSGDIVFASASGLGRFTSARSKEVGVSVPPGEYIGDVAELSSGDWLLPWRPDAKHDFQLVTWQPGSNAIHHTLAASETNAIQPVGLGPHVVPNRHPSGLHDWPDANLLCLNAYTSNPFAAGSVRSVRLYALDSSGNATLLGVAPVERDGSFFVHVPSEQALQIELLDASGKTLKRESGFFWMRHGEQRVCVGCHAGPETAPENAVPQILLKSTTPANMSGAQKASGEN
jgi:hypothetical protein